MALRGISEDNTYKVQAWIVGRYRPLITCGNPLHNQVSRSSFGERRKACETNLDLWLDGNLYPLDPLSKKRPKFQSPGELLEYVAKGENGLLGYVKRLESSSGQIALLVQEKVIEIGLLQERYSELTKCWGNETGELQAVIVELETQLHSFEGRISLLHSEYEGQLLRVSNKNEGLQLRLQGSKEKLQDIERLHSTELSVLRSSFSSALKEMSLLRQKLDKLVRTPYGVRQQVRGQKDLSELVPTGGHAKATQRLSCLLVAPATTSAIQAENLSSATHKRLCGSHQVQEENAKVFASILSKTEINSMMSLLSMTFVGICMANHYLEKAGASLGPHSILDTCDQSGITEIGYSQIYKKVRGGLTSACKDLRVGCLPKPYQINLLCKELNSKIQDYVGEWKCIENTYNLPTNATKSKKSSEKESLKLTKFNSLFLDIQAVQQTMVRLYGITPAEIKDGPLIFVLKMDEAELVHGEKLNAFA